ncbi:phage major capsid protein, partial [Dermabacter hominis]|uniref:phage major capsid protein n=1 Tax=Dermabacter hominis TaxID=36740 RepID=UPI00318389C6
PVRVDAGETPQLRALIPRTVTDKPEVRYLRQTSVTNNAAPVAAGGLKPTSTVQFDEQTLKLSVIAHVSQPLDSYFISDYPEVLTAINNELLYGIVEAEERLFLSGDGKEGRPLGILNTRGVQVLQGGSDILGTTRRAITRLESINLQPGVFAFHPSDWEKLELSRNGSGQLEYSEGPINRAEKRLWGTQVAVSTFVPEGTGVLLELNSCHIVQDKAIKVEASSVDDDFMRNQLRIRTECRSAVAVTRPAGIVKIDLASAEA